MSVQTTLYFIQITKCNAFNILKCNALYTEKCRIDSPLKPREESADPSILPGSEVVYSSGRSLLVCQYGLRV